MNFKLVMMFIDGSKLVSALLYTIACIMSIHFLKSNLSSSSVLIFTFTIIFFFGLFSFMIASFLIQERYERYIKNHLNFLCHYNKILYKKYAGKAIENYIVYSAVKKEVYDVSRNEFDRKNFINKIKTIFKNNRNIFLKVGSLYKTKRKILLFEILSENEENYSVKSNLINEKTLLFLLNIDELKSNKKVIFNEYDLKLHDQILLEFLYKGKKMYAPYPKYATIEELKKEFKLIEQ